MYMSVNFIKKSLRTLLCSPAKMASLISLTVLWTSTSLLMYSTESLHSSMDMIMSLIVGFFVYRLVILQNAFNATEYKTATQDSVTKIYNEKYFNDIGKREIKSCLRSRSAVSVLIFKIDNFEDIRGVYGHKLINKSLFSLAENIKAKTRRVDIFARLKDNEFAILCTDADVTTTETLAKRVQLITKSFVSRYTSADRIEFTCSVAVAQYFSEIDREFNDMIIRAEAELESIDQAEQLVIA